MVFSVEEEICCGLIVSCENEMFPEIKSKNVYKADFNGFIINELNAVKVIQKQVWF